MVGYTGLRENYIKFWIGIKPLGVYRSIRGCILDVNPEGLVVTKTTILLILTWELRYSLENRGQQNKESVVFEIGD